MNMKERITALRKDKRGVSPVIGVIMMIAIVVIIAAVVAAFAYGIIGGVNKAPSTALVVEGVKAGDDVQMKIFHHGGDTITDAFQAAVGTDIGDKWENLEMRVNGAKVDGPTGITGSHNASGMAMNGTLYTSTWKPHFQPGDQVNVTLGTLDTDDSIIILHVPSDSILQRVTVM